MNKEELEKNLDHYNIHPILEEYAEHNKSMSDQIGIPVYIWKLKAFNELNSEQIQNIWNLANGCAIRLLIESDTTIDLYYRVKKLETYIKNLDILLQDKGFYINKSF